MRCGYTYSLIEYREKIGVAANALLFNILIRLMPTNWAPGINLQQISIFSLKKRLILLVQFSIYIENVQTGSFRPHAVHNEMGKRRDDAAQITNTRTYTYSVYVLGSVLFFFLFRTASS